MENNQSLDTIPCMSAIAVPGRIKYGGVSYRVLSYARFKSLHGDKTFSIDEYLVFCNNQYKPSDIERAVKFLQIHGYIVEYRTGRFQYIESGVLVRIDAAQSEKRWAKNSGAFKKGHRGVHDNHGHISPASSDAENDLDLD